MASLYFMQWNESFFKRVVILMQKKGLHRHYKSGYEDPY